MTKFLASGLRRDLLVLTYTMDEPRAQELKRALEDHYDERIKPRDFQGTMEALVSSGFLSRRVDGVHERYSLTDGGEIALLEHYGWLQSAIDGEPELDTPEEQS